VTLRRPSVRVLFTSGYTENAIVHHGRLDAGVLLLAKPYRRADLARMVRAALDGEPAAAPEAHESLDVAVKSSAPLSSNEDRAAGV
jgi:hypothetical protein